MLFSAETQRGLDALFDWSTRSTDQTVNMMIDRAMSWMMSLMVEWNENDLENSSCQTVLGCGVHHDENDEHLNEVFWQ